MPQRSSSEKENHPLSAPRRSSRFKQENQPKPEESRTPKPSFLKNRIPLSDLTPLNSLQDEDSVSKSQKQQSAPCSMKSKGSRKSKTGSEKSARSRGGALGDTCVRRSARLSKTSVRRSARLSQMSAEKTALAGCVEIIASSRPKEVCSSNGVNLRVRSSSAKEKRVKLSSERDGDNGGGSDVRKTCNTLRKCNSIEDTDAANTSDGGKEERFGNLSTLYKIETRVTRRASREIQDVLISEFGGEVERDANLSKSYKIEKRVTRRASRDIQVVRSSEYCDVRDSSVDGTIAAISFRDSVCRNEDMTTCIPSTDVGGRDGFGSLEAEKKEKGAKRKLQVQEELLADEEGWTKEQELALERAYFAAKPTPNFWKKVAKMVPGKSSQECFDKIHSELMTPPQPRTRSRTVATKSPLPLSASELLNSTGPQTKKRKSNKLKSHLAHKAVRQLLTRQCNIEKDSNADLFNVLEQTFDGPTQVDEYNKQLQTPEHNVEEPGFGERWVESSASGSEMHLSRLSNSCETAVLISPPVLKKVKNKALHEKYIDQLHSREARRKAASLRAAKSIKGNKCAKENYDQKLEVVKDAKNALIFCAKDAINQFHQLQNALNDFDNTFDDSTDSSEHEFDDGS